MRRLLFDVNVILDVLLDRRPFVDSSSAAWAAVERGDADGLLCAHAITRMRSPAAGARRAKCDAIIMRNPRDFKGAPVKVLTPAEAVAWIEASR